MRFATRLLDRQYIRRALEILRAGNILHCSFQPLRQGALRLASGRDALEVAWHQSSRILRLIINGKRIRLNCKKDHDAVLDLALDRTQQVLDRSRSSIEQFLPVVVGISVKRRVSVFALRLAEVIRQSSRIVERRDNNGYGRVQLFLPNLAVQLHVLENGHLPSITINNADIFMSSADVKYLTRAIYVRQRQLRRSLIETTQALAA